MSAKAVREYHGKLLLAKWVKEYSNGAHVMDNRAALVTPQTDYDVSSLRFQVLKYFCHIQHCAWCLRLVLYCRHYSRRTLG